MVSKEGGGEAVGFIPLGYSNETNSCFCPPPLVVARPIVVARPMVVSGGE